MGHFSWYMKHTKSILGDKGDDPFNFNVPSGEIVLDVRARAWESSGVRNGFSLTNSPSVGATGQQHIVVHWWFDGTGSGGPGEVYYYLYATTGLRGSIMVFEHRDFEGMYKLLTLPCRAFGDYHQAGDYTWSIGQPANIRDYCDNMISSIVVLKGNWMLFQDYDYKSPYLKNGRPIVLPPGLYSWVENLGITNDSISSLRCVPDSPNF